MRYLALALLVWSASVAPAALITINGAPVLFMTPEEFRAAIEAAKAEGAAAIVRRCGPTT